MVKRALIIGINYPGTKYELGGCVKDAHDIKKVLQTGLGFEEKNINLLTDTAKKNKRKTQPNRQNILRAIKWLTTNLEKGDQLYFHYSGHGTQVVDLDGDESDGLDESIVPCDGLEDNHNLITDDELRELLIDQIPKGVYLMCVLDCCHSGSAMDLKYTIQPMVTSIKKEITRDDFPTMTEYLYHRAFYGNTKNINKSYWGLNINREKDAQGDVVMLSGCRDDQVSLDIDWGNEKGGVLTICFIKTLKKYKYRPTYLQLLTNVRKLSDERYLSDQVPQVSFGTSKMFNRKIPFCGDNRK